MKLPVLLAQYLYQHKKMALPGIGVFHYEGTVPEEKNATIGTISFSPQPVKKYDDELVDFVKTHTGKMRTLAEADIDSYVMDIKEFINIGKPCVMEGLGTILKKPDGSYDFQQGNPVAGRLEEVNTKISEKAVPVHENEYYSDSPTTSTMRTLLVTVSILAGLALIGWGGYYFYKKYEAENKELVKEKADPGTLLKDADTAASNEDSVSLGAPPPTRETAPDTSSTPTWKFVLRTAGNTAAQRRYDQLKSYGLAVEIQPVDSFRSIVYLPLSVVSSDTLKVKDSLGLYYGTPVSIVRD